VWGELAACLTNRHRPRIIKAPSINTIEFSFTILPSSLDNAHHTINTIPLRCTPHSP
jgi:hypothetical protein